MRCPSGSVSMASGIPASACVSINPYPCGLFVSIFQSNSSEKNFWSWSAFLEMISKCTTGAPMHSPFLSGHGDPLRHLLRRRGDRLHEPGEEEVPSLRVLRHRFHRKAAVHQANERAVAIGDEGHLHFAATR